MKGFMRIYFRLAIVAVGLFICQQANATSLTGKVIEINDGDEFTIFNLNRPVRIKLIGIDAPEKDQSFGAAAKQHLMDLVYDKVVTVEYSGMGPNSILIGLVRLNETDINAQMIRDGAAWFDPHSIGRLTETQREIYVQSEKAARSEKRGLWQDANAVAPWDFVKAEEQERKAVSSPSPASSTGPRAARPTPELTSLSLLHTGTSIARPRARGFIESSDMSWATDGPFRKTWRRFQPAGENFSVLLPEGKVVVKSIPVGDQTFDVNYYLARDGETMYELIWFSAPDHGETDSATINSALNSFLRGVVAGFQAGGGDFQCEPTSQRDISVGGYDGREFNLSECTVPGAGRIYTKVVEERRQLYAAFTFYKQDDNNVPKFLKSFTVIGHKNEDRKPKSTK